MFRPVSHACLAMMMLMMVLAERYGLDVHLLANTLLVTTLLSMLTLPVLAGY